MAGLESEFRQISTPELQVRLLPILKDFQELCSRHNIRFFLDAGTLLGAVRQQGWIPWDDDLDVLMLHDQFDSLRRVPDRTWAEFDLQLVLPWRTNSATDTIRIIRPSQPVIRGRGRFGLRYPEWNHLCIDLFLIESSPTSKNFFAVWRAILRSLQIINLTKYIKFSAILKADEPRRLKIAVFLAKGAFFAIPSRLIQYAIKHYKYLSRVLKGRIIPSHPPTYWKLPLPPEALRSECSVVFEGQSFTSLNFQPYLKYLYGVNYLLPPPLHKREPPAYHRAYEVKER